MIEKTVQLNSLWELLDQGVASFEILLHDVRQEWEYLKKDDVPSLLSLLQTKEIHISKIKEIQGSMDRILIELMGEGVEPNPGETLSNLTHHVSHIQAKKIINYQNMTDRLKQQIIKANEQNKRFIQETLDYLEDIFSFLIFPVREEPVYVKDGRKGSPSLPTPWMDKRV
jgi:hypothetical protein